MSNRSSEIWDVAQDSIVKFDYFVCGVSGAIFAYIIRDYSPHRLQWGIDLLEPASLIFLAASFFTGLKRIEAYNLCVHCTHDITAAGERAERLTAELKKGNSDIFIGDQDGRNYSRQEIVAQRDAFLVRKDALTRHLDKVNRKVKLRYNLRNIFLLLGFLTIFFSKVLLPYEQDFSHQSYTKEPIANTSIQSVLPSVNQTNKLKIQ